MNLNYKSYFKSDYKNNMIVSPLDGLFRWLHTNNKKTLGNPPEAIIENIHEIVNRLIAN